MVRPLRLEFDDMLHFTPGNWVQTNIVLDILIESTMEQMP